MYQVTNAQYGIGTLIHNVGFVDAIDRLLLESNFNIPPINKDWLQNHELRIKKNNKSLLTTDQRRLRCAKYKQTLKLALKEESKHNIPLYKNGQLTKTKSKK